MVIRFASLTFCEFLYSYLGLANKSTYRKFGRVSCWYRPSVLESCCKFQLVHFVFVHLLIGFKIYDGVSTVQRIPVSVVVLAFRYKTCTRLKFLYKYFPAKVVKFPQKKIIKKKLHNILILHFQLFIFTYKMQMVS